MTSDENEAKALWAHILPFAFWIGLMGGLGAPAGWKYAVRTAVCLVVFLALRPWRGYEPLKIKHLIPSTLIGILVFIAWILPESKWLGCCPTLQTEYLTWAVLPLGKISEPLKSIPYAPEEAGWLMALIRLSGSAFVIALIEEFFWRGFLYRWLIDKHFTRVDLGTLRGPSLLAVSVVFGIEHAQWLVGIIAGLAYGWLMIKTRHIWPAAIAHVITNFLLGLYVLATGSYQFW